MPIGGRHVPSDVIDAVKNGRIIEAIKAWRSYSGETLGPSKDFIEQNWISLGGSANHFANKQTNFEAKPMVDKDAPLPKQELLLKILNMTTSDNDGQALVAMRKANAFLDAAGWTWEKLLSGKIVVVEDPFAKIETPTSNTNRGYAGSTPPRPAPQAPPQPQRTQTQRPPPPPPPKPKPQPIFTGLSSKKNIYPGFCYGCGYHVPAEKGFVFNPADHNPKAQDKFLIICIKCNQNSYVSSSAAPKKNNSWTATPSAPSVKLGDL